MRTTALVSTAVLFSRVLGFIRDMSMAWLLGNSLAADALVIALRLPHVLRRLFGEGTLSMSLTADFVRASQHPDPTWSDSLVCAVQWRLAIILICVVLACELAARPLTLLLAPGMGHNAALIDEAAALLRLCLPYAFTAGMAALGMARLHSMQRFFLSALTPAIFNLVVLTFAAVAALYAAAGDSEAPYRAAWLLAWGVLCGGLAQWLLQALALRRARPPTPGRTALAPGLARQCLARLPAGLLGAAAPQLAMLGAMTAASWLPQGGMAALYYAERLIELPLSIVGASLGITSLPTLTHLAARARHADFAATASHAIRLSLYITLPAMTGLLALASPLVELLFARGAFDAQAVEITALALCGYAPGLPAYGLTRPLLAACHATGLTGLGAYSGVLAVLLAVGTGFAATLLPPHYAALGPPMGVSLGLWAQSLLLYAGLNRHLATLGASLSLTRPMLRGA